MIMKTKSLFVVVFLLVLILCGQINTFAWEHEEWIEPISLERQQKIRDHLELKRFSSKPADYTFTAFDVNKNGFIAIGSWHTEPVTISVYRSDGSFEYGYHFETSSAFELKWNGENLMICLVRGNIVVELSPLGEIVRIFELEDTGESYNYWRKVIQSSKKTVGNRTFIAQNDLGWLNAITSSDSQVVVIDEYGETDIIYDVTSLQLASTILGLIFFLGMLTAFVGVGVHYIKIIVRSIKRNPTNQ